MDSDSGPASENVPHYTRVHDFLRNDIVAGVFQGDERLKLSSLCVRYGVSMPPIREALNQLQVEGLVVIEPNRGARVRGITQDFIKEVFEIRIALEPALVRRSAPRFTEAHCDALTRIQDGFEAAIRAAEHSGIMAGNRAFHTYIYRVNPNHEAIRVLHYHSSVIATMRNRFGYEIGRFDRINAEHRALIQACRDRDADFAYAIARSHIEHSVTDLLRRMQQGPALVGDPVPGLPVN